MCCRRADNVLSKAENRRATYRRKAKTIRRKAGCEPSKKPQALHRTDDESPKTANDPTANGWRAVKWRKRTDGKRAVCRSELKALRRNTQTSGRRVAGSHKETCGTPNRQRAACRRKVQINGRRAGSKSPKGEEIRLNAGCKLSKAENEPTASRRKAKQVASGAQAGRKRVANISQIGFERPANGSRRIASVATDRE